MDPKRIVALVVGASVMVLIFSAILVPIVNDAQKTTGDTITISNDFSLFRNERYLEPESLSGNITGNVLTLNDYTVTLTAAYIQPILGDTFYMQCKYGANTASEVILATVDGDYTVVETAGNITFTMSNGEYSFSIEGETYSGTYNKLWCLTDEESATYALISIANAADHYYDKAYKPYVLLGIGTAGHTIYYDGNYVAAEEGAEITITPGTTIADGTTDIYTGTTVTATFNGTPVTTNAWLLVEENATGHATHGSLYSMISVIPIISIIGIVLAVVGVAIVGRNDY